MKKYCLLLAVLVSALYSCGSDDDSTYIEVPQPVPTGSIVSPVVLNLNSVPYQKLSAYNFFKGEMKNLEPVYKVIPYDLNSSLFTDYASKKRFIWMPEGVQATYTADEQVLNFPSGTVLIKNFYYDAVQPGNTTRIIETRLMIKKGAEWIFANYVWNDEQTEAVYDVAGSYTPISFNHDGNTISTDYRIPADFECASCHRHNEANSPIGVKPQNLNKNYNYGAGGSKNQLAKWIEEGYLKSEGVPSSIVSTVDWTDASQPLELRVRSYIDINCAHCHAEGTRCDYTPMRLAFHETTNPVNLGICVVPMEFAPGTTHIVAKRIPTRSLMYFRLNTTQPSDMMPMLGRSVIHTEGVQLIKDWITGMDGTCN